MTVDEALTMIRIGRTRFYELVADGTITTVKLGRRRLVHVETLRRLVAPLNFQRLMWLRHNLICCKGRDSKCPLRVLDVDFNPKETTIQDEIANRRFQALAAEVRQLRGELNAVRAKLGLSVGQARKLPIG